MTGTSNSEGATTRADEHKQPQCVPPKQLMIGFHPPVWAVRNDPPFCPVGRDRWSEGRARHRPCFPNRRNSRTKHKYVFIGEPGRSRQFEKRDAIRSQNYRSAANSRGSGSCGLPVYPYRISARGAIFGREPALASSDTSTGTRPPTAIAAGRADPSPSIFCFVRVTSAGSGLYYHRRTGQVYSVCYSFSLKGAAA